MNDSDKFIKETLSYYKVHHIETSQSILTGNDSTIKFLDTWEFVIKN